MARPSQRFVLLLSLCLLLQEFAPLYAGHLANSGVTFSKRSEDESEDLEDNPEENGVTAVARFAIPWRPFAKMLFKGVIKATEWTTKISAATSLVISITQGIKGCGAFYPSLNTNWGKFSKLLQKYEKISANIKENSRQAAEIQIYGNSSFYEYRMTRTKMENIADEQQQVFKSLGPDVLIAFMNSSFDIQQVMKKANESKEQVDLIKIDTKYKTGFDLAVDIAMPALTLAMPGIKKLKNYVKGTVVGRKMRELKDKFKGILKIGKDAGKDVVKKLAASKLMSGTRTGAIATKLKSLINKMGAKFNKALKALKYIKGFAKAAMKIGLAAFSVWDTFSRLKHCKDTADNAEKSVEQMGTFITKNEEFLTKSEEALNSAKDAWKVVHDTAWAEDMLTALEGVRSMMIDAKIVKQKQEATTISQDIQAFVDGAGTLGDYSAANGLQRDLNAVLHLVPFTLSCYTIKGKVLKGTARQCVKGENTFAKCYDDVKKILDYDEETTKCKSRTGELYVSVEKLQDAWKNKIKGNDTIYARCLVNNKILRTNVLQQLQQGLRKAAAIATKVGYPDNVDDIQAIMDTLPDPADLPLPMNVQNLICTLKGLPAYKDNTKGIVDVVKSIFPTITAEAVDKQKCPAQDTSLTDAETEDETEEEDDSDDNE